MKIVRNLPNAALLAMILMISYYSKLISLVGDATLTNTVMTKTMTLIEASYKSVKCRRNGPKYDFMAL